MLTGVLGAGLGVGSASGMNVTVNGGSFIVSNPTAANGGYTATLASQATLTVTNADPVNPRVDLVCCTVVDNGDSTSYGMVQVVTGTPASSPVAPATPASSARLALIAVPALTTSVVTGDITDVRSYTCAVGGIVTQAIAFSPPGYNGCYGYDAPSDRLYHNAASGVRQPHILPFSPQTDLISGANLGHGPGSAVNLASVTIDVDGATDIKVTYCVPGVLQATPANAQAVFAVQVAGTQIAATSVLTTSADPPLPGHGFTGVYHTSSLTGDTPSAGTHAVALVGWTSTTNATVVTGGAPGPAPAYMRVEPVTL